MGNRKKPGRSNDRGASPPALAPEPVVAQLPPPPDFAGWILPQFVSLILAGYIALHWFPATIRGNELGKDRALFSVINAVTLTGFQQSTPINDYTAFGRATIFLLIIGGALLSLIGSSLAVVRILKLPYRDRRVIASAGIAILVAMLAGVAIQGTGRSWFAAVFQSVSAFTNSGLYVGRLPSLFDWQTHLVLMPLSILGGLGLPALMELFDCLRGQRQLSNHSQSVLALTGGCYLIGLIFLLFLQWPATDLNAADWRRQISLASAQAINFHGTGFLFQFGNDLSRPVRWFGMLLMSLGGCTAGTAGGIKLTTLLVLFVGVRQTLSRRGKPGRAFGVAAVWLAGYAAIVFATAMLLFTFEPQSDAERLVMLAVSATANAGFSIDPVNLTGEGLYVLCAAMLAGRLMPLAVLWWMVRTVEDADVAVG